MTVETTDVLLIGAGPIGIEIAVALKQCGFDYIHVDSGQIGSTISWYAPETTFFSSPERIAIAGVPLGNYKQTKTSREEYLTYLRQVVVQFDLEIRTHTKVSSLEGSDGEGFNAVLEESKGTIQAKRVILAIGDMHSPRELGIPGEDLPHVSHYFEDPHKYFGKRVLVVGGKNSAIEACIRLHRVGCDLTLSYRGDELCKGRIKYWLYPEIIHLIKNNRLSFLPSTTPLAINGNEVTLGSASGGEDQVVTSDSVLLLTGYKQDPSLFEQLGVELTGEGKRPTFNVETMETNVPNVYVAGTASAGTQLGGVKEFIETSHVHVDRILAALKGDPPPKESGSVDKDFLEN